MKLYLLAIVGTLFFSFGAQAAETWEISAGPGAGIDLSWFTGSDMRTSFGINNLPGFSAGVGYNLGSGLEVTLNPTFSYLFSSGSQSSSTFLKVLVGLNYSFFPEIKNSPFVEGGIGFNTQPVTIIVSGLSANYSSATNLSWGVRAGKRFAITESVTYRPEIRYSIDNLPGSLKSSDLSFLPLEFSFFL